MSTTSLLMHNTMRIADGHLDGFREAVDRAVAFVEEHGPQLMVQVFVDDDRMLAHSFQLYPDSAAVLAHWRMSDPYIRDVMEHCTIAAMALYGDPDDAVRDGLRSLTTQSGPAVLVPRTTGFLRPVRMAGSDRSG